LIECAVRASWPPGAAELIKDVIVTPEEAVVVVAPVALVVVVTGVALVVVVADAVLVVVTGVVVLVVVVDVVTAPMGHLPRYLRYVETQFAAI
jgi:hypothetical protein